MYASYNNYMQRHLLTEMAYYYSLFLVTVFFGSE